VVPSATVRTRGLPLTRRLLCLLSYEGLCESTSAVPERERPVGRGVSLHVNWPMTAHIPDHQHHAGVATECKDTPEVERMTSLELVASAMAWPRSAI
jgi:hypothetical protein